MSAAAAYKPTHGGYSGTVTGRMSCAGPGVVDIPRRPAFADITPTGYQVIGLQLPEFGLSYAVMDMSTGMVAGYRQHIRSWRRAHDAAAFIERMENGELVDLDDPLVWRFA